jgi:hypothetical protein
LLHVLFVVQIIVTQVNCHISLFYASCDVNACTVGRVVDVPCTGLYVARRLICTAVCLPVVFCCYSTCTGVLVLIGACIFDCVVVFNTVLIDAGTMVIIAIICRHGICDQFKLSQFAYAMSLSCKFPGTKCCVLGIL